MVYILSTVETVWCILVCHVWAQTSLPRGRCLDRSAEASEGEVEALRAVAGSLSWIARQCRPDEAGTASTLQGSVSRAIVKDLSDANRAVNRLKQKKDVGLLNHAIPLGNLRTVSSSDAALDLDRPDCSTQGGFMVVFTTSAFHQQGSASMSLISWSSHKVKRSVSASLAGEVYMMSEGLAECEWISGVLESAVYQDYEPSLHRRKSISLLVEPTVTVMKADSHLQIDPSTVCHRCEKCFRTSGTRVDGRLLQTDGTRIMRDQKEHADTEGEVQMGTTRADGRRRLDEEKSEQCYHVATVARWCPVNRG